MEGGRWGKTNTDVPLSIFKENIDGSLIIQYSCMFQKGLKNKDIYSTYTIDRRLENGMSNIRRYNNSFMNL